MPHRKKPRNSGVFWRSRGQATRFALMLQRPSRCDVFWGNAKDIACGKSSILGSEPAWLTNSESGQKKNKIFFEKGHDENHGPFFIFQRKILEVCRVPKFTESKTDRAYESFMQQIPGFQRDPPEAETIQRDLEKKQRQKGEPHDRKSK